MSTPIIDSGAGPLLKMGPLSGQGAVPPVQGASTGDHPDFAQMLAAMDTPTPAPAPPQEEDTQIPTAAPDASEVAEDDANPLPRLPSQPEPRHAVQGDAPTRPPLGPEVTAPSVARTEPAVDQPQRMAPRTAAAPAQTSPAPTMDAETPVHTTSAVPQNNEHSAPHRQAQIQAGEMQSRPAPLARVQQATVPQRSPETLPPTQTAPVQDLPPLPTASVNPAMPDAPPQVASIPMQTPERSATRSDKQAAMAPDALLRAAPATQARTRTVPPQPTAERSPRVDTTSQPFPTQTVTRQTQPSMSFQTLDNTQQPAAPRAEVTPMPMTETKRLVAPSTVETPPASVRPVVVPATPPTLPETIVTPARNGPVDGQLAAAQFTAPRSVSAAPQTADAPARAIPAPSHEGAAGPIPQAVPERSVNILVRSVETPAPKPTQRDQPSAQRPAVAASQYAAAPAPEAAPKTQQAAPPATPNALPRSEVTDISTPTSASRSQIAPAVQWAAEPVSKTQTTVTAMASASTPVPVATPPVTSQPTAAIPPAAVEVQVRSAPYSLQPDTTRPAPQTPSPTQAAEVKPTVVSVTLGTAEVRAPALSAAHTAPAPVPSKPTPTAALQQPTPAATLPQPMPALPFVSDQQTVVAAPPLGTEAKAVPIAGASIAAEVSQRKPSKADMLRTDTPRHTPDSMVPTKTTSFTAQPRTAFATSAPMTASIPMEHSTKPDAAFSLLAPIDGGDLLHGDPLRAATATAGPAQPLRADMTPHIARQMVEVMPQAAHRPVEIALSPQELGRVRMSITTEDGAVTVNILAERADTLDLMRRNIEQLGQSFRSMGYDQISFSFGQGMGGGEQGPEGQGDDARTASVTPTDSDTVETPTPDAASAALRVQTTGIDIRL